MTHEEFSNLEVWRSLPTYSFNTLFMETITELLQRVEKLENENKEIKEILIMFINHIRHDGDLRQFGFEEKEEMVEIAKKWLNLEDDDDDAPCGGCKYVYLCVGYDRCPLLSPEQEDIIQIMDEKVKEREERLKLLKQNKNGGEV